MARVLEGVRAIWRVLSLFLPSHFHQNRKRDCHPVLWLLSLEVSIPERKPGTLGETEVALYDYCPLSGQAGWVPTCKQLSHYYDNQKAGIGGC